MQLAQVAAYSKPAKSEIWEATGVLFIFSRDGKNWLFKLVIAEFLKGDSCCDGGKDGDVWKVESKLAYKKLLYLQYMYVCNTQILRIPQIQTYLVWLETLEEVSSGQTP